MNEQPRNLSDAILAAIERFAHKSCFRVKRRGLYENITYRQFQLQTFRLAHFFGQQGLGHGDRVVIIADNSPDWMVAYAACLLVGGVAVPVRTSIPLDKVDFILRDSGARVAVVQGTAQENLFEYAGRSPDLLCGVVVIDDIQPCPDGVTTLSDILSQPISAHSQEAIRAQAQQIDPDALALIQYTASETSHPKGAVFTHAQRLQTMEHLSGWLTFDQDDVAFSILPWGYAFSRDFALHYFLAGVPHALVENMDAVLENMQQTSPTLTQITPFTLESYYNLIIERMHALPEANQEVFHWALAVGKEYRAAGSNATRELQQRFVRADMTFFSQIRGEIGGRMRRVYTVGAPMPQRLAEFTEAIGLIPLELYSITEAGGFPAINQPTARRFGSCGKVAPGFQLKVAEDGEILVKSPALAREYWQQPPESRRVTDADGWFHTGDLGYLDANGYLFLTGRKEARLVLSTSRKVRPSTIEKALIASPFVFQAAVFGEGRPYLTALIVPHLEALAAQFQEENGQNEEDSDNVQDPAQLNWYWLPEQEEYAPVTTTAHATVKKMLDKVVGEVNRTLDRWEQIRRYSLLEQEHSRAANELVRLMPGGRQLVAQKYAAQIEAMYPRVVELEEKEITQVNVTPERLRALLEKESILDAWLADAGLEFLFELARDKQIDVPAIVHICDIAASIAQMENEERPLSTALIVGDPARIARILPASQVQLLRHDHIRRMRRMMVTLAAMVDGMVLGFTVDKHGYVRGIQKLDASLEGPPANMLLGPQFRRHAAISYQCEAVVFFVPAGGRQVRVFANGQLVGRYSNGDWSPENIGRADQIVTNLASLNGYNQALLERILRCAFQMSEDNLGAIFIIGNADTILERSDAPEISHFAAIISASINNLSDEELINFAKQDGATVVDTAGKFRGCMVLLRPGANTKAEIGPGKGARHSSAAKMSAEAGCLAITVSQDGPITIYDSGRRVLSL